MVFMLFSVFVVGSELQFQEHQSLCGPWSFSIVSKCIRKLATVVLYLPVGELQQHLIGGYMKV